MSSDASCFCPAFLRQEVLGESQKDLNTHLSNGTNHGCFGSVPLHFFMAFRSDPFLLGIIHLSIYGNAACANKNPGTHLDPTTPSYDFIHPLGPAPHNGTCSPSAGKSSGNFWEKKGKLKKARKKSEVLALSRLQTFLLLIDFGATPQAMSFVSTESKLASPNKKY